jgi:formylglycine-generating enzyme required for sulfatase activity
MNWRPLGAIVIGIGALCFLCGESVASSRKRNLGARSQVRPGEMVSIPAGPFLMGCNEAVEKDCPATRGFSVGKLSQETTAAFRIDRTEVTVGAYKSCVDAGRCSTDGLATGAWTGDLGPNTGSDPACNWGKRDRENHPINCVDWYQAKAYCEWAGRRLPTGKEWEKAARGSDGQKYPWGNLEFKLAGRVANIADEALKADHAKRGKSAYYGYTEGYDDGYAGTAPTGSYPAGASPYGALDMIGNVAEWVADDLPGGNVPGHKAREFRGGSWGTSDSDKMKGFGGRLDVWEGDQKNPQMRDSSIGFRCAQ